jgi:hypothetical protein
MLKLKSPNDEGGLSNKGPDFVRKTPDEFARRIDDELTGLALSFALHLKKEVPENVKFLNSLPAPQEPIAA